MQFYTVVACKRTEDAEQEIWQTTETWLEVDDNLCLWAHYPFKNRQSCAKNYVEKNDCIGGKKWDVYKVSSLYFPEVHTTSYEATVKFCQEIGDRPETDEDTREKQLKSSVLVFSVRHALEAFYMISKTGLEPSHRIVMPFE